MPDITDTSRNLPEGADLVATEDNSSIPENLDADWLKRILAAYQEDTAKEMTTDGINYWKQKESNPKVNDIIKWLEDNEAWYSIEPVTIEVSDG